MKPLLIFAFLFLTKLAFPQSAEKKLQKSYQQNSKPLLQKFFKKWSRQVQPISPAGLSKLNDTLKNAYMAFSEFYKPVNNDSVGGSEWGNDLYKAANYLVVQNELSIYFADKIYYLQQDIDQYILDYLKRTIKDENTRGMLSRKINGKLSSMMYENYAPDNERDRLSSTIANFRPRINAHGKTAVYLTPAYNKLLNVFLGKQQIPFASGGAMNTARATGESKKRKDFLEQNIKIWPTHWGGGWLLHSYPTASSITFDPKMAFARINYTLLYESGEAFLENRNGKWNLLYAKRTRIQ